MQALQAMQAGYGVVFGESGRYAGVVPALLLAPSSQWLFPSIESKAEKEVLDNFKKKILNILRGLLGKTPSPVLTLF